MHSSTVGPAVRVARAAFAILAAAALAACGSRPATADPKGTEAAPSAAGAPAAATAGQRAEFARWFAAQPRAALEVPTGGAKVLILKFNDFQCPPCATTHTEIKPVIDKYRAQDPSAVRYVMVDYPLDSECNPYVALGGPHPAACEAAAAVRLAWQHKRAEAMIDWVFANQARLTPDLVRQGAREIGQIDDFDAQYEQALESLQGDIELGHQLGIRQTPTFFVNGVRLEGGLVPEYLDEAIKSELQAADRRR
ncbi:MAG: DsbA family protein [Acidobacteria bacterium]|nr:DsbA family protein [Acidobacteriota bacterium]